MSGSTAAAFIDRAIYYTIAAMIHRGFFTSSTRIAMCRPNLV
jgi:hypothetical protein